MTRYSIHVPLFLNDGSLPSEAVEAAVEDALLDAFGAFTALGTARGVWKDRDGTVYTDLQTIYAVDTDHPAAEHTIASIAERVREAYAQVCVYTTAQEITTTLHYGAEVPA